LNKYSEILKDILYDFNYIERDINSKNDFVSIICPEHGVYYKQFKDIVRDEGNGSECPRCQFLRPSQMFDNLQEAIRCEIGGEVTQANEERALYFRLLVTHKKTGLIFQKIGISTSIEDFKNYWDPWKWPDFEFEAIEKIECKLTEANALQKHFQNLNSHLKITVPKEVKFNHNKTYFWDEIWQSKSKTIPVLREIIQSEQKNKCSICNKPLRAPTLDHMHIRRVKGTGFIRSVCCSQCNTFIARAENNASRHGISNDELPEVLRRMAEHLEKQTTIIHPTEIPKQKKVGVREWNKVKKNYFKVYPKRKVLPDKPIYETESWLQIKNEVNEYLNNGKSAR